MLELMNDISELVYVSDTETYEVLYINETGKKRFQADEYKGLKCYQLFQGLDHPCDFCTNPFLKKNSTYAWEHSNPVTGRHYLLKDRLVDWEGRNARIEIAFDITAQVLETKLLKNALDAEQMTLHCIRELQQEHDLKNGIKKMLRQLGEELHAQRTYIFELQNGVMNNTYEWCAPQIQPEMETLQGVSDMELSRWLSVFESGDCVIIEDLETLKDASPGEYETLSRQGIHSLVAAPLEQGGELIGFIGVDNPPAEKITNIAPLLHTLRYFLMATMCRMTDEAILTELSFNDTLTGLYNRNRYLGDIEALKRRSGTLGVVYMDLNGLKELNDRDGHAAGDEALLFCANKLLECFPQGEHYRIGGDEFVVFQCDRNKTEFYHLVSALHDQFGDDAPYRVAIGSHSAQKVEQMVLEADKRMYEDKRRFYSKHNVSSRYRKFRKEEKLSTDDPLVKEYNMLMSSMQVSVSKHLLQDKFPVIWANDCYYEMTGYTKQEYDTLFHNNCLEYFAYDLERYEKLVETVRSAFAAGRPGYEGLLHLPRKDGTYVWIRVVGTFTDESIHGVPVVYTVFTDVSDLVQMEKEQSITYDSLPGFAAKLVIEADCPRLVYGNKQFNSFFGASEAANELLRVNFRRNKEIVGKNYIRFRAGEPVNFPVEAVDQHGKVSYFQLCGDCVEWVQQKPVYLLLFLDITEITRQRQKLSELAFTDPVTGGFNRTCFELEAGGAVAGAPANTYVLVSLDIQKFKVINDLFGIVAGDQTLCYVYHKIQAHLGEGEFVARVSSDVFCLLLRADAPEDPETRIARLAEDVNSFNKEQAHKYLLVLEAGIYPVDKPDLPMTQLQDRANVARKQAKNKLSTQLCQCRIYKNQDRLQLSREKEIENRMQDALKNREFVVYLQPKQDLKSCEVTGCEALVRWMDPEMGLIPPNDFIPLFEKNGFVVEIDLFVFEQVCALIQKWENKGLRPLIVSVNMSRAHLVNPRFLERYEEIRGRYGISPGLLEIEVTETLIFENPELLSSVIDEIHMRGYHCSMDDFGSGYSSLNVLKDIRVDTLKLDKAFFTTELAGNPWEEAIISGVVELAKKLRMKTVAEGVETSAQAEFLQKVGCDMLQGYFFSRPVPIDAFEQLVFGDGGFICKP